MRRLRCSLPLAAALLAACQSGCRNSPSTLANPFLAPDRVPPPATRSLAPGTAAPYYPGDPLPGTGGSFTPAPGSAAPSGGTAAPWSQNPQTAPPANTPYSPAVGFDTAPSSPTDPWPAATQGHLTALRSEPIRIPDDAGRLRYDPLLTGGEPPANLVQGAPPSDTIAQVAAPTPIQSILPTPDDPSHFAANSGGADGGNAQPPADRPRRVEIRATAPSVQRSAVTQASFSGSDGFRPQGTSRHMDRFEEGDRPSFPDRNASDESFSQRPRFASSQPHERVASERYGFGEQYQWLRGQLETAGGGPAEGEWRIRYQRADEPPDQLGGSVIIANPLVLGDLEPGDFVIVRGQMHSLHYASGVTVPAYQLAVVQRQP